MKILISTQYLDNFAGSELFVKSLAEKLFDDGHKVTVFSPFKGKVAKLLECKGVNVVGDLSYVRHEQFDIIHAQHNVIAIMTRSMFPDTPMVFMSHGLLPELEQPPSVDLCIKKFIVVSEEIKKHFIEKYNIPENKVAIVRNFIDTERFSKNKAVNKKLKKIMVLSNHFSEYVKNIIEEACEQLNVDFIHVGRPENEVQNVENYINNSDLVVTLGRGALEAMACERNVIIFDMHGGDGFVNENNFFEFRKNNFSGRYNKIKFSVDDFKKELLKYDPGLGFKLRSIIRNENSLEKIIEIIYDIYNQSRYNNNGLEESKISENELYQELYFLEKILLQTKEKINKAEEKIKNKEVAIENLIKDIEFVTNSKFWKMRNKYLSYKNRIFFLLKNPLYVTRKYFKEIFNKEGINRRKNKKVNMTKLVQTPSGLTSIIVTSHNYADFLDDCVSSLVSQKIKPKEVIVIDDASLDEPEKVMQKYKNLDFIKFYSVNFKNAQLARNFGLSRATGEYLVFLDADDYLRNDFLEKTQYVLHNNPKIDCVYSDRENFGPPGALEKIGQKKEWKTSDFSYKELAKHNYISLPALIRREGFGGFDEKINRFQDWDAWLTYLKGKYAYHISEPLFFVRFHGKNKTFGANKYTEKLKVQMKHNLIGYEKIEGEVQGEVLKNKRVLVVVGFKDNVDYALDYIEKIKSYNHEVFIYFSGLGFDKKLSREIAEKLVSLKISFRIARKFNSDEVCNFVREGKLVSPYTLDFVVLLGAETQDNISNMFPVKFKTDLLWESERDSFLDTKFLDEGNWMFNKEGIKKLFNL